MIYVDQNIVMIYIIIYITIKTTNKILRKNKKLLGLSIMIQDY
jgi:hypothetical protein